MLDLNKEEEIILEYWKKNDILNKVRARNKNRKPFYFLDGPPFVSGDLHPGQIWTKALKDVVIRYKRYRGFDVVDKAGYDVHGLPIENRLEKELGVQSKKDIEQKIGVEKFVKECRAYVERYIGRMDADYERFGISLDFKNPYLPYKNEYIETAWYMFKSASDKGFLYRGKRTLIYCPHCETPLSQGSMEVEYQDVDDPSIYLAFKIDEKKSDPKIKLPSDAYLVVWTTTPWTIPANVAVAVNPKNLYVVVKAFGKNLIIAKDRMDAFASATKENLVVLMEFYGSELSNVYYISPLEAQVPKQKELRKYHKVVFSESLVSMSEGTGLVHMAPGHGIEDFAVGKLNKLPIFSPVNSDATYNDEAGLYKGLQVPAEANKIVLQDLEKAGAVLSKSTIRHSYPYCWRCHSKLIFLATDQWFMNIQKIKKKLVKQNEKVSWHPEEVKEWQKAVLENSPDWCISRQRYWGIPMPIWLCTKCDKMKVIGSREELKKNAINKQEVDALQDLHRPYIDKIRLTCECGGEMERVKDILDVWFDSGVTFRASLTEEQFEKLFPVDLIIEYIEQIRAWFQYLMKCGIMVYGKIPFRHVMVHGIMAGTDGRKMSKSFGNYRPLSEITQMFSADAFRLWSIDHQQILNRNLNEAEIKESQKMIIMLHNISSLIQEYQESMNYKPKPGKKPNPKNLTETDMWILSKAESLVKYSTERLDGFELYKAASTIKNFIIEDFSRFYLKSAKKRMVYVGKKEAKSILDAMNYVLYKIIIPASVMTPFVAESVYRSRYATKESIFLEEWPKPVEKFMNERLEADMMIAQETITAILNSREKAGIKLRWPISKAVLEIKDEKAIEPIERLSDVIKDSTNAKKIELKKISGIKEEIVPIFHKLGPEFKSRAGEIAESLKSANAEDVRKQVTQNGYYLVHTTGGPAQVKPEQFAIVERGQEGDAVAFKYGRVWVSREISKELREEGLLREFERRVQLARRDSQLKRIDKIALNYKVPTEYNDIIKKNASRIKKELNIKELSDVLDDNQKTMEFDVEEEKILLQIRKL